jgi:hypothetical protein
VDREIPATQHYAEVGLVERSVTVEESLEYQTDLGLLTVERFFLPEDLRRGRLGRRILAMAEEEGRRGSLLANRSRKTSRIWRIDTLGRHLVPLLFGKGASLPSVENCRRPGRCTLTSP